MFVMGTCPVCGGFELEFVDEACELCEEDCGRIYCADCDSEFDEEFVEDAQVTVECPVCGGTDCDLLEVEEDEYGEPVFIFECYDCETVFENDEPFFLYVNEDGEVE